jgi:hypothetical protein
MRNFVNIFESFKSFFDPIFEIFLNLSNHFPARIFEIFLILLDFPNILQISKYTPYSEYPGIIQDHLRVQSWIIYLISFLDHPGSYMQVSGVHLGPFIPYFLGCSGVPVGSCIKGKNPREPTTPLPAQNHTLGVAYT